MREPYAEQLGAQRYAPLGDGNALVLQPGASLTLPTAPLQRSAKTRLGRPAREVGSGRWGGVQRLRRRSRCGGASPAVPLRHDVEKRGPAPLIR
jgi:hypothetical protein